MGVGALGRKSGAEKRPVKFIQTLTGLQRTYGKKRVDELVCTVASFLNEGTGKADVMKIRIACAHTVRKAVEHLSSDETGRLRNC
jgi:hypothetical protein